MVRVGEVADQIRGVTFAKGNAIDHPAPGYSAVLRAGNIQDSGLSFDDLVYVPTERINTKQFVRENDVLIAASSGSIDVVGKSARSHANFDGGFGAFLKVLRPSASVDPSYFAHFFRTRQYRRTISALAAGANINNLKNEHLDSLQLPLPPLDEQRRIAAILDEADALRDKSRLARSRIDDLTQAIYLRMFGLSAAKFATVNEIALPTKGSIRTGPFGSQLLHSEFVDEGVPVLGLDNVVENIFTWGERRYITQDKYTVLQRYTVKPGDVLISIMGTCGRCVVVPADIGTAINTKHICAITLNPDIALPEFVRATFLWHPRSRHHLAQRTKGSIMDGLNMGIVKDMPVPLPSLDQQQEFVTRARAVEALHQSSCWLSQQTDELFVSLQSRAFRGEL
ncbi:restriction endonuclease subunit S [Mycolicibacterium fortuitum]